MATPRTVSESYWDAECRRAIDEVVDHYEPDGTYGGPDGLRRGHAEIRKMYEEHARSYPGVEVEILQEFPRGDSSALEFDALLVDTDGKRSRDRGATVGLGRDGRFASVRSYEDAPVPSDE